MLLPEPAGPTSAHVLPAGTHDLLEIDASGADGFEAEMLLVMGGAEDVAGLMGATALSAADGSTIAWTTAEDIPLATEFDADRALLEDFAAHVGAALQQPLYNRHVALLRRGVKRRVAGLAALVDRRAAIEQQLGGGDAAELRGRVQRG